MTKPKLRPVLFGLPPELVAAVDELAERELLTRTAWVRREIFLAVRASRHDESVTNAA
jgi:hypothetical protein